MWEMKGFTKGARGGGGGGGGGGGSSFTAHHCAQLILFLMLSCCFIIHCLGNTNVMTHPLASTFAERKGGDTLM